MRYSITEKRRKSRVVPITNRLPVLLLCLLVFGFLSKAAFNALMEKRESSESLGVAQEELSKWREREIFIKEELERLSTEEGREAKFREKFGVGRPGEQIAIIVEAENTDDDISDDRSFWLKTKNFFKILFEK